MTQNSISECITVESPKTWYDNLLLSVYYGLEEKDKDVFQFWFRHDNSMTAILLEQRKPLEWFKSLERNMKLTYDNVSILKEFLNDTRRYDLVFLVDEYEARISILNFFRQHLMKLQHMRHLGELYLQCLSI